MPDIKINTTGPIEQGGAGNFGTRAGQLRHENQRLRESNAELLAACKAMASKDHDFVDAIQMLEAAIKKAEGECRTLVSKINRRESWANATEDL